MPRQDDESPLIPDDTHDTHDNDDNDNDWMSASDRYDPDAPTDLLPDAAPRERARSTAMPLKLATHHLPDVVALGAANAPLFTGAADEAYDDAYDDAYDGTYDDDDLPVGPVAAPETARLPAVDLAPSAGPLRPVGEWDASAPLGPGALLPVEALEPAAPPVVIPGARRLRRFPKNPFIARRPRPLTIGLLASTIIGALLISGLAIAYPVGEALSASGGNPLGPSAGVANASNGVRFIWYTAKWGDTPDSIAKAFHVALGGIYELNHLAAGDELLIGRQYMIPLDSKYGASYRPPSLLNVAAHYGDIRYGPNWWDSIAGSPTDTSVCAPNGGANRLGYQLQAPNWGARWVRGFIVYGTWVYHTGVDLAAPQGNVIHAAQAGQVIWAGYDATNGLGWSVKIDHCNHVSTVYGHMMRILVHTGDFVDVGSPVGLEGSTGNSTGPHLHFMVEWNNLWVDPMLFYSSQSSIRNPST
jgi:murein DD-endopeptidase MepM/ murein hydrolase activator NlpD